jgi:hypothetical protein
MDRGRKRNRNKEWDEVQGKDRDGDRDRKRDRGRDTDRNTKIGKDMDPAEIYADRSDTPWNFVLRGMIPRRNLFIGD